MHCTGKTLRTLVGMSGLLLLLCFSQSNLFAPMGELHAQQLVCWSGGEAMLRASDMIIHNNPHGPVASQGQRQCPRGYVPCGQHKQLCCPS
jgi:hypothetical protein